MPKIIKIIRKFAKRFHHDFRLKGHINTFTGRAQYIAICSKCKFEIIVYKLPQNHKSHSPNLLKCEEYIIKSIIE
jgi:hypothetical protein